MDGAIAGTPAAVDCGKAAGECRSMAGRRLGKTDGTAALPFYMAKDAETTVQEKDCIRPAGSL
jgi:hypothetical protein